LKGALRKALKDREGAGEHQKKLEAGFHIEL
jgi:hypothetical protein